MTLTDLSDAALGHNQRHLPDERVTVPSPAETRWRTKLRRWGGLVPLPIVLAVIGFLHGWNIAGWPLFSNDDEGTYYAQAWAVLNKSELAHYTYWYDHPPLGWLQLAVFLGPLERLVDSPIPAVVGGRIVMVLYTMLSAALLYRLGRNLDLRAPLALAVPVLWALSPLVAYEGRQVFLDNLQLPWLLLAMVLATDRLHRLPLHLASGLSFAVAVLTKETALLAAPAVLLALWRNAYRPTRAFSIVGWLTCTALAGSFYPLYAVLKKELLPGEGHVSLLWSLQWQLSTRDGSGSALERGTAANGNLMSWLDQDVVLLVGGTVAALICVPLKRLQPIAILVLIYVLFMFRPSGYLPQMLVIVVLPFAALLLVGLLDASLTGLGRLRASTARVAKVVLMVVTAIALVPIINPWSSQWRAILSDDRNGAYIEALTYMTEHVPKDSVVVTDDTAWNDLVRAGWASDGFTGAVWFFKLDRDIEAKGPLPRGWRDVDYLLVAPAMGRLMGTPAVNRETDPNLMAAYENSEVVRQWGSGEDVVVLRSVRTP